MGGRMGGVIDLDLELIDGQCIDMPGIQVCQVCTMYRSQL